MRCRKGREIFAYLVYKNLVANQKQFNSKYTSSPKMTNNITGNLLGFLYDALGDVARWKKDLVNVSIISHGTYCRNSVNYLGADAVFVDCLNDRIWVNLFQVIVVIFSSHYHN